MPQRTQILGASDDAIPASVSSHDHRTETALRAVAWLHHAETHGEGVYVLQALAAEARTADCHDVATHVDGLVRRARAHASCLDDSTTLVGDEFKVALEYCVPTISPAFNCSVV